LPAGVINAGDGINEHPTQALLDLFTLRERWGSLEGKKVALIGDIKHSRVARSNILLLGMMGARVTVFGPGTLLPEGIEQMGCTQAESMEEALTDADAVMALRIQLERQREGMFPSKGEYSSVYGIDEDKLRLARPGAPVLHPGPVNRGVEISHGVCGCERSLISEQVTNGVAVRMAVIKLLAEGGL